MDISQEYITRAEQVVMKTYSRNPIVWDHGEGVYLYDIEGRKYLDFAAGIAVYALGYGNERYNEALKAQIDKLLHTSNLFYSVPLVEAAEKLTRATGLDRVFFTNSGAEAIEGAIKAARRRYFDQHGKADSEIIAMEHSFHGRSLGALSVTGTKKYREPFEPLIGGVVFAEYNNLADVAAKLTDKTCAILLETVQGEGGIFPADPAFLQGVRKLCDENDCLLILDEIQCGMGRTGSLFAYQQYGIKPDIVTTAKALGCGVPVGAFVTTEEAAALRPGDHGTTYGGNPFVLAAVSRVFDLFEELQLVEHVKEVGAYLTEQLDAFVARQPHVVERRGIGLMQGLACDIPVAPILRAAMEHQLVIISAGAQIVRLVPPLIITKEQIDEMLERLEAAFTEAGQ